MKLKHLSLPLPTFNSVQLFSLYILIVITVLLLKTANDFSTPQFWAEDCIVFYAQSYQLGLASLFSAYAGYLHVLPFIGANMANEVPLLHAPLLMLLVDILFRAIAVAFLIVQIKNRLFSIVFFISILFCPQTNEVLGNLTSVQWYSSYALLGALLMESQYERWYINALIALFLVSCALSTPLSITLLPLFIYRIMDIANMRFRYRRLNAIFLTKISTYQESKPFLIFLLLLLILASIAQFYTLITSPPEMRNAGYDLSVYYMMTAYIERIWGAWLSFSTPDVIGYGVMMLCFIHMLYLFKTGDIVQRRFIFYLGSFLFVILATVFIRMLTQPAPLVTEWGGDRYFWLQRSLLLPIIILPYLIKLTRNIYTTTLVGTGFILASVMFSPYRFTKEPIEDLNWPQSVLQARLALFYHGRTIVKIPPGWLCLISREHN